MLLWFSYKSQLLMISSVSWMGFISKPSAWTILLSRMPEYERVENLQGYNQIAQYYFHPGEYNNEVDGEADDDDGGSDEE